MSYFKSVIVTVLHVFAAGFHTLVEDPKIYLNGADGFLSSHFRACFPLKTDSKKVKLSRYRPGFLVTISVRG